MNKLTGLSKTNILFKYAYVINKYNNLMGLTSQWNIALKFFLNFKNFS